jgi:hypothetical protein
MHKYIYPSNNCFLGGIPLDSGSLVLVHASSRKHAGQMLLAKHSILLNYKNEISQKHTISEMCGNVG